MPSREREVLGLACEGLTNTEIGERLCLSVKTIETYLAKGAQRLGARNIRHAVAKFAGLTALKDATGEWRLG
jgi:DNA-binding NarL/FixJ family response regulator